MSFEHLVSFNDSNFYNNREISWLQFNQRVLEEAVDPTNPLLERLRFLAIFSANLDEFFMIRVAGLKDQMLAGYNHQDDKSGLTPKEQLKKITTDVNQMIDVQQKYYQSLVDELAIHQIEIQSVNTLNRSELTKMESYFDKYVFPALTPLAIDAYHPFPVLKNQSINIAVELTEKYATNSTNVAHAIVQVPILLGRLITVYEHKHQYILLEELIAYFIDKLFKGYQVKSTTIFRVTRNADFLIDEEGACDLLKEVEKELKKREWGTPVRLEINKSKQNPEMTTFLLEVLELKKEDLYIVDEPLDLTFLFQLYKSLKQIFESLVYPSMIPQPAKDMEFNQPLFDQAAKKDILLHHPYESFQVVIDLIHTAANDPDVLAIKQTLYRVSGDSPIIKSLKLAARNGKQVTVLVELKARFDEERNVHWAKELEQAGCHVIYGMNELKTHSKILLIVRKNKKDIEHYVHLGTGNYNDQTAAFYTDISLITTRRNYAKDAIKFFNYLSGYTKKPSLHVLSMAPYYMKDQFIDYIDQEIHCHQQTGNGYIIAKMNALTDKKLITKMYQASQAGVKIDLIVRGICCLRPGIPNVSENITVRSIVGRFLEHSRIYFFQHNGDDRIFLASADMMTRNMKKRIELLFPILQKNHQKRIKQILELSLADNVKAREQLADGSYRYAKRSKDDKEMNSQFALYKLTQQRVSEEEGSVE
ncbi:polyphosphate kinase [Natronobacillus azotifigens]|uniref:Polyphosphate kinase n=1 Tax=Natronobacillus azotifigens TaxID=472978 RepID=A0A9J6RC08_9BACI|nr:RNA degradosome polyphosphate kinase [Natronobacillus azotifigens]MCZ0702836.1 RNA degradosome polyphosphate kinase [Natronobacillus azotifigens]